MTPPSCGIFLDIEDAPEMSYEEVATDFSSFANYAGVEGDEVALKDITSHLQRGHLKAFGSIGELTRFLNGAKPILSKIGIITKERQGKVKKRLILDTKASFIKQCSAKHQRVLLPRI